MADDHVIDIQKYLEQSHQSRHQGAFAVWGGGDERVRFALPVWRAIYLVGGDWGGIVSLQKSEDEGKASDFFVLDLKEDPARIGRSADSLLLLRRQKAPALTTTEAGGLAILLGEEGNRWWCLQVMGSKPTVAPEGKDRETLLFLAGECAGLLFFRELATPLPSSSSTL